MIYLDHNATTPPIQAALDAIRDAASSGGNPSSVHRLGQKARRVLDDAVHALRALLQAPRADVVFTSGGTEADALALQGLAPARYAQDQQRRRVLVSAIEHPAIVAQTPFLEAAGFQVDVLPVTPAGQICLESLEAALGPDVALVSVMLANNETGVVQPLATIARLARAHGAWSHTDAVQAVGKIPIDMELLGVDALSLSAHKFAGPKGVGALLLRPGMLPKPLWDGGSQQLGSRPGTEATPLIAGMAAAAQHATQQLQLEESDAALRSRAERLASGLMTLAPSFRAVQHADVLPNTLALGFVDHPARQVTLALEAEGVLVSGGAACHSTSNAPSATLRAMGLADDRAREVLRFSLGWETTENDIDEALKRCRRALHALTQPAKAS